MRDKKGKEVVEEFEETVKEYEDGHSVYKKQKTQRKVINDNALQIAQAFRAWLSIEARRGGWTRMGDLARVWPP